MKCGILSDTHGFFHPALAEVFAGVDVIFHAGDIGTSDVLTRLQSIAPTVAVRGNIDGEAFYDTPRLEHREYDGMTFTPTHNAGDLIHPIFDMSSRVLAKPADILISGHYHAYWCSRLQTEHRTVLWLNPGAAGNAGYHTQRQALLLTVKPRSERIGLIAKDCILQKIDLGPRGDDVTSPVLPDQLWQDLHHCN